MNVGALYRPEAGHGSDQTADPAAWPEAQAHWKL